MHIALLMLVAAAPPALDLSSIDRKVSPGDDFNAFANGNWEKKTQIPADKSLISPFQQLSDLTRDRLAGIIKDAAKAPKGDGTQSKVGEYYATIMNEKAIEAAGVAPLRAGFAAIDAIADKKTLAASLGASVRADVDALNATNFATPNLFGLWVVQALDDPQHYAPYLLQGGLSLPDREYYTSRDQKMVEIVAQFRAHVEKLLTLAGIADAAAKAAAIVKLETKIAQVHATRSDSNDVKTVAVWNREDLTKKAPGLDWAAFLEAASLSKPPRFFIWHPKATAGIAALVGSEPLDAWKAWLTFHLISQEAPFLSKAFVDESFAFNGKTLNGTLKQRERWQRGVSFTNLALGEAIGEIYAKKYFSPEAKAKLEAMVALLLKAFAARIDTLEWMSPATKAKAKEKVSTLVVGVGYPDVFRDDFGSLRIVKGDAVGNHQRAGLHEYQHQVAKLDKPVDRHEWWMTPQTVNAVNLPLQNAMNFPAALMQAPFFDLSFDAAVNFGGIGSVIGHEISHSFDDAGSEFDARGLLVNWWSPDDLAHFKAAGTKLAQQFDAYELLPGVHLDGRLILSENIADVAGLATAYDAWKTSVDGKPATAKVDGFTPDQRFFISYAQHNRVKAREAMMRARLVSDAHAPGQFRAQTVRNVNEWYEAFGVKKGQKLFLEPSERAQVW